MSDFEGKIAIYTWGVEAGAFANVALSLAKGLDQHAISCEIVPATRSSPVRVVELQAEGYAIHSLEASRSLASLLPLTKYLRRAKPDVLISMGWLQNVIAVISSSIARWDGILVLTEHAHMSYKARVEHRGQLRLRVMPWLARHLYPRADAIVGVSSDVIEDLVDKVRLPVDGLRLEAIPNAIDLEKVRRLGAIDVNHPWLTNPRKTRIIQFVGRLARQKNVSLLISAMAELRDKGVRLIVVGDGPERSEIFDRIAELRLVDRIDLVPAVRNPYCYMARADLFVLPSEEEGFGLVLVEAMALGIPVLATACSQGPIEILQGGRAGVLVPPGNASALAAEIDRVLGDLSLRQELSELGRARVEEFKPERVAASWLQLLGDLQEVIEVR